MSTDMEHNENIMVTLCILQTSMGNDVNAIHHINVKEQVRNLVFYARQGVLMYDVNVR